MNQEKIFFRQIFRIIFVVFTLYLIGVAFWRWDGFRYYASFSEFLPSVALVTIFWHICAVLTAALMWLLFRTVQWFCRLIGWKIKTDHLLLFICSFILLFAAVLFGKKLIWKNAIIILQIKQLVLLGVIIIAMFLTWLLRNKAMLMKQLQEHISPLVWIFGIWAILSVPIVAYNTWWVQSDNAVSQKPSQPFRADKNRPNIILFTFDALSARNMSVNGYKENTTPFLNEWAKSASLFTRLQAESNFTTPTTASLMTGKRLWTHQTFHLQGTKPVRSDSESMPLMMRNYGYNTMAFIVNPVASVKTLGVSNGFKIAPLVTEFAIPATLHRADSDVNFGFIDKFLYEIFGDKIRLYNWILRGEFIIGVQLNSIFSPDLSVTTVPPELAFNRFLSVIDNSFEEPFFAWIHVLPPHDPYLSPPPFKKGSLSRTDVAIYNEFIRYCDKQFGDFIAELTERKLLSNTVVILSSDHGESFEHDYIGHSLTHLYEQVTNVPLIILEPEQTQGRIINDIVEQVDIPATILNFAGIPVPSWMEGRSLIPHLRGESIAAGPAFSMNFMENLGRGHPITRGTIAVWEGDYKLIHYFDENQNKSLLFNLKKDPAELDTIFSKEHEVGQRLLNIVKENLKKANEKIAEGYRN